MTNQEIAQMAARKARYGHRSWLYWRDRDGNGHAAQVTPDSLKAAMLAVGVRGTFTEFVASTATPYLMTWSQAVIRRRNVKYSW